MTNGVADIDKSLNSQFQSDMEQLFKSLADNNRVHLSHLYDKHDSERKALEVKIRDLPEQVRGHDCGYG